MMINEVGIRAGAVFGIADSDNEVIPFAGLVDCGCGTFEVFGGYRNYCLMCT